MDLAAPIRIIPTILGRANIYLTLYGVFRWAIHLPLKYNTRYSYL